MNLKYLQSIITIAVILFAATSSYAGNIDPACKLAWNENSGWVNFAPAGKDGVTVTDTAVSGMAWSENMGWINLSPSGQDGVINNGSGNLSGYAWGENVGWINFAPANGGVFINRFTGWFHGWAWGENIGWINFGLTSQTESAVRTSWSLWGDDWNADPDGDGLSNLDDPDADDDGIDNDEEYSYWGADWNGDPDGDGMINLLDPDADNDGFSDSKELDAGTDPADPADHPATPNKRAMPWIPLLLFD